MEIGHPGDHVIVHVEVEHKCVQGYVKSTALPRWNPVGAWGHPFKSGDVADRGVQVG